jgi:hypothetical protein
MKQRSLEEISHENWDGFIKGVTGRDDEFIAPVAHGQI